MPRGIDGYPWGADGHAMQHNPNMNNQQGEPALCSLGIQIE